MTSQALALVVNPDAEQLRQLHRQLREGFRTEARQSAAAANRSLDERPPDLAIIALELPDTNALELLAHPGLENTRAIVVTSQSPASQPLRRALLSGAHYALGGAGRDSQLQHLIRDLQHELGSPAPVPDQRAALQGCGRLLGDAPPMHALYRRLRRAAAVDVPVLILGEAGSGKTLAAETLHQLSRRRHGPFICLDCDEHSAGLLASRLFGHGPGQGLVRHAKGGSLLLEGADGLNRELQAQLLNSLERGPGSGDGARLDLQLMVASRRNPQAQLRDDFRRYLCNWVLQLPPLRERDGDVAALAHHFAEQLSRRGDRDKMLAPDTVARLEKYSWPGNVRELRSVVERAWLMAEEVITPDWLPELTPPDGGGDNTLQLSIGDSVQDAEKKLTLATLTFYKGDKRKAAQTLGVSLKTLYNRLNAYQAERRTSRERNLVSGRRESRRLG